MNSLVGVGPASYRSGQNDPLSVRSLLPMFAFTSRSFVRILGCLLAGVIVITAPAQTAPKVTAKATELKNTAVRPAPRRAVVEGVTEPIHDLRITDLTGRDIATQVDAKIEGGRVTLDVAQPSPIVLKSKVIQTLAAPKTGKIVLPGGAIVPLSPNSAVSTDKAVWFRMTLGASPNPAPWDDKFGSYVTELTFGLKRPDGAPLTLSLDQPVIIKLAYKGLTAEETTMISLEGVGLENEKSVALRFRPQSPTPTVLVRSSLSDVDIVLSALPRLSLQPERSRILGLGLDEVGVLVTNLQPDGKSVPVERDTPLAITVEGSARITPTPLVLSAGSSTAHFFLRSSGLASIGIHATADGISGFTELRQSFPTGPLIAVILGGAVGGYARRFMKRARRSATPRRVAEGIVVALIAFVAGVLGVGYLNLPASIVATEAGAFLTGALSGFVGVSVLESLSKKSAADNEA